MDAILRALNERAKELNTLYRVEEVLRSPERPLQDLLQSVVQAAPDDSGRFSRTGGKC